MSFFRKDNKEEILRVFDLINTHIGNIYLAAIDKNENQYIISLAKILSLIHNLKKSSNTNEFIPDQLFDEIKVLYNQINRKKISSEKVEEKSEELAKKFKELELEFKADSYI